MTKDSDISVIVSIQSNDEQAIEILYNKYVKKLYNYFYYRVYDKATSEDLLSETWFHIFDKIPTFDTSKSENVSWWMYSIAHNKLVDYFRKQKPDYWIELDDSVIWYDSRLIEKVNANHLVEKITETLKDIHPHAKDVVLMKIWEWMSHWKIATALSISEANSKKIFSRSVKYLQENYADLIPFIYFILIYHG